MVRLTCAPATSGPTETHSRMQNRKSLPNQALQRTIGSLAPLARSPLNARTLARPMSNNDVNLVRDVVRRLRDRGHDVWLFGGWAEELAGVRPAGPHGDIDLLLRAPNFVALDALLRGQSDFSEIEQKRFSHKRAFEFRGVRIEVLLVQPSPSARTILFDGRGMLSWPADTFAGAAQAGLPIVSLAALALYRSEHDRVVEAYAAYRSAQASAG
jgi:hypothetical protein